MKGRLGALRVLCAALLGHCACSHVQQSWQQPRYDAGAPQAVKRVAVLGWAPEEQAQAGPVLAAVTTDLLKLRKNYLVQQGGTGYAGRWSMACTAGVEGVVVVRALEAQPRPRDMVALTLSLELLRCRDGALLFRNQASGTLRSHDKSLVALTQQYVADVGAGAALWAAPSFVLLQQMVAPLFNPALSDAEVEERIELGQALREPAAPQSRAWPWGAPLLGG